MGTGLARVGGAKVWPYSSLLSISFLDNSYAYVMSETGGNMKKLIFLLLSATAFLITTGCATMPMRGDYIESAPPQIVTDQEHAVICFLREGAFGGSAITYYIWEDEQKIGLLKSGSYFIHQTKPGKHTYWAETEARTAVTLEVKAAQTYYVEGGINLGFWAGRPQLIEITKPVADKLLPGLKYLRLATDAEREQYKAKEQREAEKL